MSSAIEMLIPAGEFKLGRILQMRPETTVEFETVVPAGEGVFPLFWVHGDEQEEFGAEVEDDPAIDSIGKLDAHANGVLYTVNWNENPGDFVDEIVRHDACVMKANGMADQWEFRLRFPSHRQLPSFQADCLNRGIPLEVQRVYHPQLQGIGPFYGLTLQQREALVTAVERGYYSVPRQCSTNELGGALSISNQAASERLRRGVATLVTNTILGARRNNERASKDVGI